MTTHAEQIRDVALWPLTCVEIGSIEKRTGYRTVKRDGQNVRAHRFSYELFYRRPPRNVIDHLCRNKGCVNPLHLEDVTQRENLLRVPPTDRGRQPTPLHRLDGFCFHGHRMNDGNTYTRPSGKQECRTCRSESRQQHRRKVSDA